MNVPDYTGKGVPDPEVGLECFAGALAASRWGDEMAADGAATAPPRRGGRALAGVPGDAGVPASGRLVDEGRFVGLITGNTEPAAHTKLARADLNRY